MNETERKETLIPLNPYHRSVFLFFFQMQNSSRSSSSSKYHLLSLKNIFILFFHEHNVMLYVVQTDVTDQIALQHIESDNFLKNVLLLDFERYWLCAIYYCHNLLQTVLFDPQTVFLNLWLCNIVGENFLEYTIYLTLQYNMRTI
jgi:hypothetical protein